MTGRVVTAPTKHTLIATGIVRRHPSRMNNLNSLQEIARAIRNLIRTGIVTDVELDEGLCRVQTGGMQTTWLNWLTCRAGRSRVWWAPSVGEQVLLLAIGGELDTAFVLPGIFSDDNPAPSASPDALHVTFPDGAVIEYEPENSALTVSGIKTANVTASDSITATVPVVLVKASTRITLDTPEVVCTNKLTTGTLEVKNGGTMSGNIEHTGGSLSSNGKVLHLHKHPGDSGGTTGAPI
nr:MAG TPA: baseplate assembly protein V [Caudoviricetes sp.]